MYLNTIPHWRNIVSGDLRNMENSPNGIGRTGNT
jgi:hypothetical protein